MYQKLKNTATKREGNWEDIINRQCRKKIKRNTPEIILKPKKKTRREEKEEWAQ